MLEQASHPQIIDSSDFFEGGAYTAKQLKIVSVSEEITVPHETVVDRTFELPKGLYIATVALFLGFIAVMAIGFSSPEMILPLAIFTVFIVGFFGVPAVWVGLAPETESKAKSWSRFKRDGIMTGTGHCSAGAATIQVLILPVLIFCWGLMTVAVAAFVR